MGRKWFALLGEEDKHIVNDIYLVHKPELKNITPEIVEEIYKEAIEKLTKVNQKLIEANYEVEA